MRYFLLLGFLNALTALYIFWDGKSRESSNTTTRTMGAVIFGPLSLPYWWRTRPLKDGESRSKNSMWALFKGFSYLWGGFLALWASLLLLAYGFTPYAGLNIAVLLFIGVVPYFLAKKLILWITLLGSNETEYGPTGPLRDYSKELQPPQKN